VITLTQTLALEVHAHGDITANCVLPSVIDTPANRRAMPGADPSRWVHPAQVARVIAWLTSPDAATISGAVVPVYGAA
jgi:NAD(P)-dependent dehydrogenase (short-subunit alcohol dehydrogenase family)